MNGKCPKCERVVVNVTIGKVTATYIGGKSWKAISYNCLSCQTVLAVEIDPIALKTDIVDETTTAVMKALGRTYP